MDSTTQSPSPRIGHVALDVHVKRPPEDEETFDQQRTPKRQAVGAVADGPVYTSGQASSSSRATSEITEDQLRGRSPDELVTTILQMQSSHSQQVADLEAQCNAVRSQLNDLKTSLTHYIDSQSSSLLSLRTNIASINIPLSAVRPAVPHASASYANYPSTPVQSSRSFSTASNPPAAWNPHTYLPPRDPPAPAVSNTVTLRRPAKSLHTTHSSTLNIASTPTTMTTKTVGASPSLATPGKHASTKVEKEIQIIPSALPNEPPVIETSVLNTVQGIWEEFKYGRNEKQSLESIEAVWGSRWRNTPALRTWHTRRKVIYDKIRELMADGVDEATAVKEVEAMRRGRSMNWLTRLLQDDRKLIKKTWKETAKAATAAKEARSSSVGTVDASPSGGLVGGMVADVPAGTGAYPPQPQVTTQYHARQ